MQSEEQRGFQTSVYEVVRQIPPGSVLTYGAIALLIGRPSNSRLVGHMMAHAAGGINAHRVVNHQGRTAPSWPEQRSLLEQEGVSFKENGFVNLRKHLWHVERP